LDVGEFKIEATTTGKGFFAAIITWWKARVKREKEVGLTLYNSMRPHLPTLFIMDEVSDTQIHGDIFKS
jgi:hypothetical protein